MASKQAPRGQSQYDVQGMVLEVDGTVGSDEDPGLKEQDLTQYVTEDEKEETKSSPIGP